ncbi:unnamed protein product [Parnassius apollo]|uniref:(apollo) hypothetical protein n=1 Tax=Parnassius apollo TaxID=110799 RepID=A0A8S3X9P2_PARAO|nr:unnamed protein product [Parnassius apollo]
MLSDFVWKPSGTFGNFCRMSSDDFTFLLNKIGPHISKIDTNMRQCIPIQERFAIALRFLATESTATAERASRLHRPNAPRSRKSTPETLSAVRCALNQLQGEPAPPAPVAAPNCHMPEPG